jgi:F0F1-type ATP synthase assembly protein I
MPNVPSQPQPDRPSTARGMIAGTLLLSGIVLGALVGLAVGALVGATGICIGLGLFVGFIAGTAAVIVRFRDL